MKRNLKVDWAEAHRADIQADPERWGLESYAVTERLEVAAVLDVAGPLRGKPVLDAGCGDGTYSLAAAERGARVTGDRRPSAP